MTTKYQYSPCDPSADDYLGAAKDYYLAETFLVAISHRLTQAKFKMDEGSVDPVPGNTTLEVQNVVDNLPGGTVLATTTITPADLPTFGSPAIVTIAIGPLDLVAGTQYCFVFKGTSYNIEEGGNPDLDLYYAETPCYFDGTSCRNVYGAGWETQPADFWFEEWGILVIPTVTTQMVTNLFQSTGTGNGNITDLGAPPATQHGHCWNKTGLPTIAEPLTHTADGGRTENGVPSATGAFTSSITGLVSGTIYYIRAYATNTEGTSYGEQVTFVAGAPVEGDRAGPIRIVEDRLHYVDAYGLERWLKGTPVE